MAVKAATTSSMSPYETTLNAVERHRTFCHAGLDVPTSSISLPTQRNRQPPAARTFLTDCVPSPNGIGIMNPSAVRATATGVR